MLGRPSCIDAGRARRFPSPEATEGVGVLDSEKRFLEGAMEAVLACIRKNAG
jgi:hypothetical protein